MEFLLKTAAVCTVVSLMALLLKRNTPELALLLTLSAVTAVMAAAVSVYKEAAGYWEMLIDSIPVERTLLAPLMKILVISAVTRVGSDICQDSGQKTLATVMDMVGTLCALAAAAPLLERAIAILVELV